MTPESIAERHDRIFGFQGGGIGEDEDLEAKLRFYQDVLSEIYYQSADPKRLASAALFGKVL